MQMIRIFFLINSISIALFFSANVISDETKNIKEAEPQRIYDVEIIIFKNRSVPKGNELNLPTPSPSRDENTLDLSNNPASIESAALAGFTGLLQEELRLLGIVKQIIRSSRYDLLSHTGWRQPGLSKQDALPVWIKGGKVFGRGYSSIDQPEPLPVEQQDNLEQLNNVDIVQPIEAKIDNLSNVLYELEGRITITLSRYLHTHANLVLRKPATMHNLLERPENQLETNEIETTEGMRLLNYALNEKRRMRSKRLHYLDHPQFGILVLITPYEPPEVEIEVEENQEIPVETPIASDKKPV